VSEPDSSIPKPPGHIDRLVQPSLGLTRGYSAQHGLQEFDQSLRPNTVELKSQTTARTAARSIRGLVIPAATLQLLDCRQYPAPHGVAVQVARPEQLVGPLRSP
jgi:hypothetical protein